MNTEDIEFAAIYRWLSLLGIRTLTEWDMLVFLHRHAFSLLDCEDIRRLAGFDNQKIAAAVIRLRELGLIKPIQNLEGCYLFLEIPEQSDQRRAFTNLMTLADNRFVRLAVMQRLNGRTKAPIPGSSQNLRTVAFGGSAGGLVALEQIVEHLPAEIGMAFVVVQHLYPQGVSFLPKLLARKTHMRVRRIDDPIRIEPNQIFVIPPGKNLTIQDGVLHLAPRTVDRFGQHRSIDLFFTSLAKDRGAAAVSVILSGMNSDGVMGTAAIKKAGGITIAQRVDTALHGNMPSNVVHDGCVDFVETPAGIAQILERLSQAA